MKYVVAGIYRSKTPWHDLIIPDEELAGARYMRGDKLVMQTGWQQGRYTLRFLRPDDSWESHFTSQPDSWIHEEHKLFVRLVEATSEEKAFCKVRDQLHWQIDEYAIIPCGGGEN